MRPFYAPSLLLVRVVFPLLADAQLKGVEAVIPRGPLVVVAERRSRWDAVALAAALPRPLVFWGREWAATGGRLVLPRRDRLDEGVDMLRHDAAVGILLRDVSRPRSGCVPSAARIPAGMVGAVLLALRAMAPVLPVRVSGTEGIGLLRRPRVEVVFGQPFSLPLLEGLLSRAMLCTLAEMVAGRLATVRADDYQRPGAPGS
ncbi:MAG: hypothetical protein Q7T26_13000 [Dehalococcoidia bacterium]|nr:hypothetical protein [Dehalococcoidia bacterium]